MSNGAAFLENDLLASFSTPEPAVQQPPRQSPLNDRRMKRPN